MSRPQIVSIVFICVLNADFLLKNKKNRKFR